MRAVIIIPARYASTRFPGKPLAPLRGPDGVSLTLIRRCWDAARRAAGIARVIIATDDRRIAAHAEDFGAEVAMTDAALRNGTERCAAAADALGLTEEIVVNLQGDAPLTPPDFIEAVIAELRNDAAVDVATPVLRCDPEALSRLREDRAAGRVGGTTAVFGRDRRALYFSKEVIPYSDAIDLDAGPIPVFHHVGLYAYRRAALEAYGGWAPGPLETLEGLEQLRFLENGAAIRCVEVEGRGRAFWEVNNAVDVARVEAALQRPA
jgi:3-deoxy-manno-octulosonate cytidylyltransferase (CMP-KDO synthetase)